MKSKLFKIETVDEFKERGGFIQRVDFKDAYKKFESFGKNFKDYRKKDLVNNLAKNPKILTRKSG